MLFIFPSLYEGFGLPPLEAIYNNCPVISSNRASLPEILGPDISYFNPEDEDDIYRKIIKIVNDKDLQKQELIKSKLFIKKYDWLKCAALTKSIYLKSIIKNEK
jgi:glycosyltransferase involved in cell wall biosynthesis